MPYPCAAWIHEPERSWGGANVPDFHEHVDRAAPASINGDGRNEVIGVPGSGTPAQMRIFDVPGDVLDSFYSIDSTYIGGAHVA